MVDGGSVGLGRGGGGTDVFGPAQSSASVAEDIAIVTFAGVTAAGVGLRSGSGVPDAVTGTSLVGAVGVGPAVDGPHAKRTEVTTAQYAFIPEE